jgi:hypothetical protein
VPQTIRHRREKKEPMVKVGEVIKVKGDDVTIQLSNEKTVTVGPNSLNLSVGDLAPEDLVSALDQLKRFELEGVTSINL